MTCSSPSPVQSRKVSLDAGEVIKEARKLQLEAVPTKKAKKPKLSPNKPSKPEVVPYVSKCKLGESKAKEGPAPASTSSKKNSGPGIVKLEDEDLGQIQLDFSDKKASEPSDHLFEKVPREGDI